MKGLGHCPLQGKIYCLYPDLYKLCFHSPPKFFVHHPYAKGHTQASSLKEGQSASNNY
jgi:hypothetical protein